MTTVDPAWAKKCSVILLNEIAPRVKKLGITYTEFMDSDGMSFLAALEFNGHITRRELRSILDERVKVLQKNDIVQDNQVEELSQHG